MGLMDALIGNASDVDVAKVSTEYAQILASGEKFEKAYQLVRDIRDNLARASITDLAAWSGVKANSISEDAAASSSVRRSRRRASITSDWLSDIRRACERGSPDVSS